jgi:hypothetical protein
MAHLSPRHRRYPILPRPSPYIEIPPRRLWKPGDRLPNITDLPSFYRVHQQLDDKLKNYLNRAYSNYQTLPGDLWNELFSRNADLLFAANADARVNFVEILCDQIEAFDIVERGPHCWVTVTPADYVLPLDRAHEFDPRELIALIRQALGDVPAIGVVEGGHYLKWGPDGPSPKDHISWHAHLIIWERSRAQLQDFVAALSKRRNMRGRSAVWVEPIAPELVLSKMIYAAKGPVKSYRVVKRPDRIDNETGEITERFRQTKDWIRSGNHVRMIKALRGRYLRDLIFGNAEGTQLARAVRYRAMQPLCRWAERENIRAELAGRPVFYTEPRTYRAIGNRLARDIGFVP